MRNQYHVSQVNRFPPEKGFFVESDQDSLTVLDKAGELVVKMARAPQGMVDVSKSYGASKEFSLSPLPKAARLRKDVGGALVKDEKYAERLAGLEKFLDADGSVLSCEELTAKGWKFDDKTGEVVSEPAKKAE